MAGTAARTYAIKRTPQRAERTVVARVPQPAPAPRDIADLVLGVYCWD